LAMARAHVDGPQLLIAKLLNNIGWLHQQKGTPAIAEPWLREAVAMHEQIGPESADLASSLNNLAIVRQARGDLDEAEAFFRRSLELDRAARGPRHPYVASTMNNLALLLRARGRLEDAEPIMREILDLRRETVGVDHPYYAIGLNNLAVVLRERGRLDDAEALYREALERDRRVRGEDHPGVAGTMVNLGVVLVDLDRVDEAEPLLREALRIRIEALGPAHPDTLIAQYHLAGALIHRDDRTAADDTLAELLANARTALPADHLLLGLALARHGANLLALERFDEAEPPLLEAHGILAGARGEAYGSTRAVAGHLLDLYERTGRPDEAARWR